MDTQNKLISFRDLCATRYVRHYRIPVALYTLPKFEMKPLPFVDTELRKYVFTILDDETHNISFYFKFPCMVDKYCCAVQPDAWSKIPIKNFPEENIAITVFQDWIQREMRERKYGHLFRQPPVLLKYESTLQISRYVDWLQVMSVWKALNPKTVPTGKSILEGNFLLGESIPHYLAVLYVKLMKILDHSFSNKTVTCGKSVKRSFHHLRNIKSSNVLNLGSSFSEEISEGVLQQHTVDALLLVSAVSLDLAVTALRNGLDCNTVIRHALHEINGILQSHVDLINLLTEDAVKHLRHYVKYVMYIVSHTLKAYTKELSRFNFSIGREMYGIAKISSFCVTETLVGIAQIAFLYFFNDIEHKRTALERQSEKEREIENQVRRLCQECSEVVVNLSQMYSSPDTIRSVSASLVSRSKTRVNLNVKIPVISALITTMTSSAEQLGISLQPREVILSRFYLEDDFIAVFNNSFYYHIQVEKDIVHGYRTRLHDFMKSLETYIARDEECVFARSDECFSLIYELTKLKGIVW